MCFGLISSTSCSPRPTGVYWGEVPTLVKTPDFAAAAWWLPTLIGSAWSEVGRLEVFLLGADTREEREEDCRGCRQSRNFVALSPILWHFSFEAVAHVPPLLPCYGWFTTMLICLSCRNGVAVASLVLVCAGMFVHQGRTEPDSAAFVSSA